MSLSLLALAALSAARPQSVPQQLDAISAQCRTPRRWFVVDRDGSVHFRPPVTARFRDVKCVTDQMLKRHIGPVGYVMGPTPKR